LGRKYAIFGRTVLSRDANPHAHNPPWAWWSHLDRRRRGQDAVPALHTHNHDSDETSHAIYRLGGVR